MARIQFLDKLTGTIFKDDYNDLFEDEETPTTESTEDDKSKVNQHESEYNPTKKNDTNNLKTLNTDDAELSVDVYQTNTEIVVRALVSGVIPSDLDISLTRDMLTIKGSRKENKEVETNGYFFQELFWGSFSRTILLPEEVEVDEAEASESHGVLTIRLPKINKLRKTKLKVKAKPKTKARTEIND